MNLGKRGNKLYEEFKNILKIDNDLALNIFARNIAATSLITDEECLSKISLNEAINLILGATFYRDDNDRLPLKNSEIKILHNDYHINYIRRCL